MPKTKIYCFINGKWGDLLMVMSGYVKDGKLEGISSHGSSDMFWAKHDIGLTSNWKHDIYKKQFPEGYELEWVDNLEEHEILKELLQNERMEKQNQ